MQQQGHGGSFPCTLRGAACPGRNVQSRNSLLLQTLRLFRNSEAAKKGRETAKPWGMRLGLAACRDCVAELCFLTRKQNVVTLPMQSSCRMREEVRIWICMVIWGMSRSNCSCTQGTGYPAPAQTSSTAACPQGRVGTADFLLSEKSSKTCIHSRIAPFIFIFSAWFFVHRDTFYADGVWAGIPMLWDG